MNYIDFFRESIRNIKTVGTFTRSSNHLCKRMVRKVDLSHARAVVELGAGDGVLTKHILKVLPPDAKLMVFEVNERFCKQLSAIQDDRLIVVCDSAEKMDQYLDKAGIGQLDFVFSAIPFVVVPDNIAKQIVRSCYQRLADNGYYLQIHYSLLTKQLYEEIFGNVSVSWIPLNIPPAFVLKSEKYQNGMTATAS